MPTFTFLEPPVPGATINSPTELSALVDQAQPSEFIGFVWYDNVAPDVVTYPVLKRLVWIDLSSTPIAKRHWNEGALSWETEELQDGSVETSHLADEAVTLAKMSIAGGSAGAVLRINGGGTAVIWDDPQNLFTTSNRLSVTVLSLSGGAGYVLTSNGVTNSWATFSSLGAGLTIALTQLDASGAVNNEVLGMLSSTVGWNYAELYLRDNQTAVTKLAPGSANYILRTNSGGTAVEWAALSSVLASADSGLKAMPTVVNTPVTFTHNLNSTALQVTVFGVCVNANNGYVAGEMVPIDAFVCDDNGGLVSVSGAPALIYKLTTTTIALYLMADAGTVFKVRDVSTGVNAGVLTAPGDWNWRAILTKI